MSKKDSSHSTKPPPNKDPASSRIKLEDGPEQHARMATERQVQSQTSPERRSVGRPRLRQPSVSSSRIDESEGARQERSDAHPPSAKRCKTTNTSVEFVQPAAPPFTRARDPFPSNENNQPPPQQQPGLATRSGSPSRVALRCQRRINVVELHQQQVSHPYRRQCPALRTTEEH